MCGQCLAVCSKSDSNPFFPLIPDTTAASVKQLLDFMYSGTLTLSPSNVFEILASASYLQIAKAVELCQEYLTSNMAPGSGEEVQVRQALNSAAPKVDLKTEQACVTSIRTVLCHC